MKFVIPKQLNLEGLILANETIVVRKRITVDGKKITPKEPVVVKSKSLIKHLPYCYYLIDLIINKGFDTKIQYKGYVNLRSELLDKVIPNNTRIFVTNALQVLGVIDVNDSYSIGEHSKSYRINSRYSLTELSTIDIEVGSKGRNIGELDIIDSNSNIDIKGRNIGNNNTCKNPCSYPYVSSFLKRVTKVENGTKRLRDEKTSELIQNNIEYSFQQNQIYYNLNFDIEELEGDNVLQGITPLLKKIAEGNEELCINVNNSVNKVFTPFTNMSKTYRKYMVCKEGLTMLSIDFKTSHLFHLLKIIIDSNPSNDLLLKEVNMVKDLASKGDIYQYVANEFEKKFNKPIDREEAKDLFITRFLYGMYPKQKLSIWIKSLFPLITEFVTSYQRKTISRLVQQSESRLLNNFIFKRIANELDDNQITCFGLFDSITVDQNHFDQVFDIMMEESTGYFGYQVPLTVEDYSVGKDQPVVKPEPILIEDMITKFFKVVGSLELDEFIQHVKAINDGVDYDRIQLEYLYNVIQEQNFERAIKIMGLKI